MNNDHCPKRTEIKTTNTHRSVFQALTTLLFILLKPAVPAQDFSTTNREALAHFWSAAEQTNRPITVLSFGDSMADSYRSPSYYLMNKLVSRFGTAGYSLNTYRNTALWNLVNGATNRGPDYFWFTSYLQVPPSGAIWWANQPTPGGVLSDHVGIFYVSQTNGGQFRMLISTNGGPWTPALVLDGYSVLPKGYFTNVVVPLDRYRLRVEGDTGTNLIIGTSLVAATNAGIHAAFTDWPGIALSQVTNVPLAIREPIFAGLKPDLIVWHMKEPPAGLSNMMTACETWWANAAPNADLLYIGTPWSAVDTNSTTTLDQNSVVRGIAIQRHRTYVDVMLPTVSYPWMLSQGFMADVVHLNNSGGYFCSELIWNDLGFFALGLNRRLTLQPNGTQLQLSYNTSTSARYRLEASTNLQNWAGVVTNALANTTFTTNFPPPPTPTYFRLGLAPP